MLLKEKLTKTPKEKFVDFATDSSGILRKLVVNLETGKQSFVPTGAKKKFIDFVHGQRVVYNPVSGKTECKPIDRKY